MAHSSRELCGLEVTRVEAKLRIVYDGTNVRLKVTEYI
jgi:hypothetical protein